MGFKGLGAGGWVGEGGKSTHFGYERQYSTFTNDVKHNKGIFIKHLNAWRLLNITFNIHNGKKKSIKKKRSRSIAGAHYKNIN